MGRNPREESEPQVVLAIQEAWKCQKLYLAEVCSIEVPPKKVPLLELLKDKLLPPWLKAQKLYSRDRQALSFLPPLATGAYRIARGVTPYGPPQQWVGLKEAMPKLGAAEGIDAAVQKTDAFLAEHFLDGYLPLDFDVPVEKGSWERRPQATHPADLPWVRGAVVAFIEKELILTLSIDHPEDPYALQPNAEAYPALPGYGPMSQLILARDGLSPLTKVPYDEGVGDGYQLAFADLPHVEVAFPRYPPGTDPRIWKAQVHELLEHWADSHIAEQNALTENYEYYKPSPPQVRRPEPFRMLAIYQVGLASYKEVAEKMGPAPTPEGKVNLEPDKPRDSAAASRMIKRAADRCGVPLRPELQRKPRRRRPKPERRPRLHRLR